MKTGLHTQPSPSVVERQQPTDGDARRLQFLCAIVTHCLEETPSARTYTALLLSVKEIIPCDAVSLFLMDDATEELQEVATAGGSVHPLDFLQLSKGKGLTSWTASLRKPVALLNRTNSRHFDPVQDFASFISVPLICKKTLVGVLNLGSRTANGFSQIDVTTAQTIAGNVSLGIERLRLTEQVTRLTETVTALRSESKRVANSKTTSIDVVTIMKNLHHTSNEINNALEIIVGNIECLELEHKGWNQKSLSRLSRTGRAAIRIGEANMKLLLLEQHFRRSEKPGSDGG